MRQRFTNSLVRLAAALMAVAWVAAPTWAQRVSDVRGTKHNLSVGGPGTTKAAAGGTTEVCVFCHTPHGATLQDQGGDPLRAQLWNRRVPAGSTYTPYTSSTLDAQSILDGLGNQPGGSSKLCLSCHDGTLAIGNVNVLNGTPNATIAMSGTGPGGVMPAGEGTTSGFTRYLGTDLSNDHPISLTYNSALATRDGELRPVDASQRWPAGSGTVVGVRASGYKPLLPLEPTGSGGAGQVQCATCHDPHIRELDAAKGNQKFLRAQRFQELKPVNTHVPATDIMCLSCHDKNKGFGVWAYSAHANDKVAGETYKASAAALREFPAGLPVWRASCLNCHDTHTVQGARRLTREGTDAPLPPGNPLAAKQGGNPAQENTCYQCHTTEAKSVLESPSQAANIESEFTLSTVRMPITTAEQGGTTQEVHEISSNFSDGVVNCSGGASLCGADMLEPKSLLAQRHVECTDCHNPHRVVKFRVFNGGPGGISRDPDAAGTHRHDETTGYARDNIASGVLRGTWGVEPIYGSTAFGQDPTGFTVKRGDPGDSGDTSVGAAFVTREYQICLKCHSNYAYGTTPPLLSNGITTGGTPSGTNNLTRYTNQAMEFQAPAAGSPSGAGSNYTAGNNRSWHPVMRATGRNAANATAFRLPWGNAIGTQTMYCSDCHGANTPPNTIIPPAGPPRTPWGPHGSSNNFLLKGAWNINVGAGTRPLPNGDPDPAGQADPNGLCFKCHNTQTYANRNGAGTTGFTGGGKGNLHAFHTDRIGRIRCNWCHVAVPHGWKNRALLVNLNDVGPEAGRGVNGNEEFRIPTTPSSPGKPLDLAYNQGPYYMNAKLKIRTFAASGSWADTNCGSNNSAITFGSATGNNTNTGKDWMKEVCSNPP